MGRGCVVIVHIERAKKKNELYTLYVSIIACNGLLASYGLDIMCSLSCPGEDGDLRCRRLAGLEVRKRALCSPASHVTECVDRTGWKLQTCEVEEYPFANGNPYAEDDSNFDLQSVLRLIPGGGKENQQAGNHLWRWMQGVARQYNDYLTQQQDTTTPKFPVTRGRIQPTGLVYCVDFDSSFTLTRSSFIHPATDSLIHSLAHLLTCSLALSLVHSFTDSLACSLDSSIHRCLLVHDWQEKQGNTHTHETNPTYQAVR